MSIKAPWVRRGSKIEDAHDNVVAILAEGSDADARLIAKAPELLAKLRELADATHHHEPALCAKALNLIREIEGGL